MTDPRKVVAIIQARMSSVRLPGKVLMDIEGKTMLSHVVERLGYCRLISQIVVATTKSASDDKLEQFCVGHNMYVYRGSESNVLDRYYNAAKEYSAGVIVRVTADCPLIDPVVTDKVIAHFLENSNDIDGASNIIKRTYPRGLDTEVFKFSAIEKARQKAEDDYHREHVTAYIYEHPEFFKVLSVANDSDSSNLRWTVDEEADLRFVREIYKRLYAGGNIFYINDILKMLKNNPSLNEINKGVKQKNMIT